MYSLLIDTHIGYINLVLFHDGQVLAVSKKESEQSHSIYALPLIKDLLDRFKINVNDLGEIFVVNGPGSFTGVRIGVTIAKTMAHCLNVSIKVITALEIMAINIPKKEKHVFLSDRNGKFIGKFNQKNKLVNDYFYLSNKEFEIYKLKHKNLDSIEEIDYNKVYEFLKEKEDVNPHLVNPLYVKNIEVVNGKKSA